MSDSRSVKGDLVRERRTSSNSCSGGSLLEFRSDLPESDLIASSCINKAGDRKNASRLTTIVHRRMLPLSPKEMSLEADIDRVLFSEGEIRRAIDRIAAEVTETYRGRELTVVSVLKGSCVFASDLIRRIPIPLELAFVGVSSYGMQSESGDLELQFLPRRNELDGRNVLVVDDILDTGRTLEFVRGEIARQGAAEVRSCVFLDKPSRRRVPFAPDWRGFEVEDTFVVGYGLDFRGRYRNLPYVGALRAEILRAAPMAGR
jgi:hypoxanthine phosphoribosyltransferase